MNKTKRIVIRMPPQLYEEIKKAVKNHPDKWESVSAFVRGNAYRQLKKIGVVPQETDGCINEG